MLGRDRLGLGERRRPCGRPRRGRARAAPRARARSRPRIAVAEHDDLGRAARQVDRDVARDLELRVVHVRVARARRSCRRARRRRASRSPARRRAPRPRRPRAARRPRRQARPLRRRADDDPPHAGDLRGHDAHDERRDEVARDVDADRVERHPAALEHDARLDLERDVGGPLRLVPAAHAVGELEQRLARQPRRVGDRARRLDTVELERPLVAPPSSPRSLISADDRHAAIRSTGTIRIDEPPAASSCGQQAPDLRRRDERVHRDHARLGERQHARRRAERRARRSRATPPPARSASRSGGGAPRRRRAASPRTAPPPRRRARRARPPTRAATPSERRPFVRSVLPDETRSTIASASPSRGAISTEPVTSTSVDVDRQELPREARVDRCDGHAGELLERW